MRNVFYRPILVHLQIHISIVFYSCSSIVAQPESIKWSKVARADLEMTACTEDSSASAVILYDYGNAWFSGKYELIFERHVRIKILSEDGYHWGTVSIPFYTKDNLQKVKDIQGQTFNLTKRGKIRKHKLNKKSVFREDLDDEWAHIYFTLPELSSGSIIEYHYKVISKDPTYLPDWYFQNSEPTRWSEYRVKVPKNLEYTTILHGARTYFIEEIEPYTQQVAVKAKSKTSNFYTGTSPGKAIFEIEGLAYRFVMKDIPALRGQPFMTTLDDYRIRLQVQLCKIFKLEKSTIRASELVILQPLFLSTLEISDSTIVLGTWESLAKKLMESKNFGRQIYMHPILRQQAENIVAEIKAPELKMKAIYDHLRKTMKWNSKYSVYTDQELDQVFNTRIGNNAELALILTSMLRAVELEAYPVLISTREHGKIEKRLPVVDQFNYVLVNVKMGHKNYLLDINDPLRPFNLLSVSALTEDGLLLDTTNPLWIKIKSPGKFEHQVSIAATLNDKGTLTAHLQSVDREYSALFKRHALKDKKEEDFVREEILSSLENVQLDSFSILNKNVVEKELITEVHFSTTEFIRIERDYIHINPMLIAQVKENPFQLPERTFPVDFAFAHDISYTLSFRLPSGYVIEKHPNNLVLFLPNNSGKFSHLVKIVGNKITLTSKIVQNNPRFRPEEYEGLREFYDRITASQSEQIVLKRVVNPVQPRQR